MYFGTKKKQLLKQKNMSTSWNKIIKCMKRIEKTNKEHTKYLADMKSMLQEDMQKVNAIKEYLGTGLAVGACFLVLGNLCMTNSIKL